MQYFQLIRGIHISTRNLVYLYQDVVKSSLIAQNHVFRTPPLTILFSGELDLDIASYIHSVYNDTYHIFVTYGLLKQHLALVQ